MSTTVRKIIILGFMGAGKTTVARSLAQQMNCEMIDLDEIIVEQEKRSVPELITKQGEAEFRHTETFALQLVLERMNTVRIIALGGGAWTIERNRALIQAHDCFTVWLDTSFELCWQRITDAPTQLRPLALDRKTAHQLYEARRPLYALADVNVIVSEDKSAEDLALEIVNLLRRQRFVKN